MNLEEVREIGRIPNNTIVNADCLEAMKYLTDKSIDLVVTSPPYDNLRTYNGTLEWSFEIFQDIAKELVRVLKDGGVIVWVVNDKIINGSKTLSSMKQCLYFSELGLKVNDVMIWKKTNPIPQVKQNRYSSVFEYMFVFCKGDLKTFNPIMVQCKTGGFVYNSSCKCIADNHKRIHKNFIINNEKVKDNIWDIAIAQNKTSHNAVFPEKLVHDHIVSWSNEGDIILDPFVGSGTTCKVAYDLKRQYIGIEKVKEYYDIACNRLWDAQAQGKLF